MLNSELKFNFIIEKNEAPIIEGKIVHNKNSRKNKIPLSKIEYQEIIIKWSLCEYLGPVEENPMSSSFFPLSSTKKLNNGLSASSMLKQLNSNLVFDNYILKEHDHLKIYLEYKHPKKNNKPRPFIDGFISFIFKNEWILNEGFDHLNKLDEVVQFGKVIIL